MQTDTISTSTSASAQKKSWHPTSAREVALRVLKELPTATLETQCQRFDELVSKFPIAQFDANTRAFIALAKSIKRTRSAASNDESRARAAASSRARDEAIRSLAEEIAERAKANILDLPMMNGKVLGDCTGTEVAAFGKGFQRIAKKVGPDRKVSDVLTADEAAKLMEPKAQ
jgi:hypothetical protein